MQEAKARIDQFYRAERKRVTHIEQVKYLSSFFKPSRILVFTDQDFAIFSADGKRLQKSFFWLMLTEMRFDGDRLELRMGRNKFAVRCQDITTTQTALFDIIQRVMKPSELKGLGFDQYKSFVARPNPLTILSRIKQRCGILRLSVDPPVMNDIERMLQFCRFEVDLGDFPDGIIPIVLEALPLARHVKNLIFPSSCQKWELAASLMSEPNRVRRIHINGTADNSFEKFMKAVRNQKDKKLFTLAFSDSGMEAKHLDLLLRDARDEIQGLELRKAVVPDAWNYLMERILPEMHLKVLNLSDTKGVDVFQLVKAVPSVWFLSLSHCDLDIGHCASAWQELKQLRGLDLSGNRCMTIPDGQDLQFSRLLTMLILDDVVFGNGCLEPFFRIKSLLKLSIARAKASKDEWERLFSVFHGLLEAQSDDICRSLATFIWDGNPVKNNGGDIFDFLQLNSYVERLSLDYCFSDECSLINGSRFLLGVESYKFLRSLSLRGMDPRIVQNTIKTLTGCASLTRLDVSKTSSGSIVYNSLARNMPGFVEGRHRREAMRMICDDVGAEDIDSLRLYLKTGIKLNVAVSYPVHDLERLLKDNRCTNEDIREIRAMMALPNSPCRQPEGVQGNPPPSALDAPFVIFQDTPVWTFPLYIKGNEIDFYGDENISKIANMRQGQATVPVTRRANPIERPRIPTGIRQIDAEKARQQREEAMRNYSPDRRSAPPIQATPVVVEAQSPLAEKPILSVSEHSSDDEHPFLVTPKVNDEQHEVRRRRIVRKARTGNTPAMNRAPSVKRTAAPPKQEEPKTAKKRIVRREPERQTPVASSAVNRKASVAARRGPVDSPEQSPPEPKRQVVRKRIVKRKVDSQELEDVPQKRLYAQTGPLRRVRDEEEAMDYKPMRASVRRAKVEERETKPTPARIQKRRSAQLQKVELEISDDDEYQPAPASAFRAARGARTTDVSKRRYEVEAQPDSKARTAGAGLGEAPRKTRMRVKRPREEDFEEEQPVNRSRATTHAVRALERDVSEKVPKRTKTVIRRRAV